jgi:hypothetical protein
VREDARYEPATVCRRRTDGRIDPAGGRLATLRQMRTRASQLAASPPAVLARHAPLRGERGVGCPVGLMRNTHGR